MRPLAARLRENDALALVDPSPRTKRAINEEAAFRRLSPGALVERLLNAIADGDRFADVLDGGRERRR